MTYSRRPKGKQTTVAGRTNPAATHRSQEMGERSPAPTPPGHSRAVSVRMDADYLTPAGTAKETPSTDSSSLLNRTHSE